MRTQTKQSMLTLLLMGSALLSCGQKMSESVTDPKAGLNGSFEIFQQGLPVNWLVYTPQTAGKGEFAITPDAANFMDGKQSLHFQVKSCSDKGGRYSPGIVSETAVKAGDTAWVRFWVMNRGADLRVKIDAISAMKGVSGPEYHSAQIVPEWEPQEYTYVIPAGMDRLRVEMNVLKPGECWIDGVEIKINPGSSTNK